LLRPPSLKEPPGSHFELALGKSWFGALLFSIVVSVIFTQVFSYTAEMGLWMGFATFLTALLFFFGIIILASRRRESERVNQFAELRRVQACDFKAEDDL
jgi:uncharacterized membrane protein YagU involved in acid resistance